MPSTELRDLRTLLKARVATARQLGIRLWIMLRDQIDYQEFCRRSQVRQKNWGACAEMGHSPATQ
jgi:hypothetical protein